MDATQSDHIGMLGTVMNALALQDSLERCGQPTRVQSAIEMPRIAEPYIRRRAMRHLEKGRVVIFAAGTGNPFFTTGHRCRSACRGDRRERAAEGHPLRSRRRVQRGPTHVVVGNAIRVDRLHGVMNQDLRVMDSTAIAFCRDNNLPIVVFDMSSPGVLRKILEGDNVGTIIHSVVPRI
jgi:uridylate kinase